jgi:hypothetical protein
MTIETIDQLVADAGIDHDPRLVAFLGEVRSLGLGEVPAPSDEVAALMGPGASTIRPLARPGRRRAILITLAVVASLGMGATAAAAASPQIRSAAQNAVAFLVHAVAPGLTVPASPSRGPIPSDRPSPTPRPTAPTVAPGRTDTPRATPTRGSINAPTAPPRGTTAPTIPNGSGSGEPPATPPGSSVKSGHTPPPRPRAP